MCGGGTCVWRRVCVHENVHLCFVGVGVGVGVSVWVGMGGGFVFIRTYVFVLVGHTGEQYPGS